MLTWGNKIQFEREVLWSTVGCVHYLSHHHHLQYVRIRSPSTLVKHCSIWGRIWRDHWDKHHLSFLPLQSTRSSPFPRFTFLLPSLTFALHLHWFVNKSIYLHLCIHTRLHSKVVCMVSISCIQLCLTLHKHPKVVFHSVCLKQLPVWSFSGQTA